MVVYHAEQKSIHTGQTLHEQATCRPVPYHAKFIRKLTGLALLFSFLTLLTIVSYTRNFCLNIASCTFICTMCTKALKGKLTYIGSIPLKPCPDTNFDYCGIAIRATLYVISSCGRLAARRNLKPSQK